MNFPCPDAVRHARSGVGDDTHEPPMGKKGEGRAEVEEEKRVTAVTVIGRYWGWKEGGRSTPGRRSKLDCGLKRGGRHPGNVGESVNWMDLMIVHKHPIQLLQP